MEGFWTHRLRWRLIGAWRWPLFVLLTVADALVVRSLPPSGERAELIPALIIASFGNLILIGLVAPWLARRLAARRGEHLPPSRFPPAHRSEVLVDRVASVLLALGFVGLVAAGLGNQKVVIAASRAADRAAVASRAYVMSHAPAEVQRNFEDTADTVELSSGYFRICGAYNNRLKAYCMYVDTTHRRTSVRFDPNPMPNGERYPQSVPSE
jgi:hypothetical protein